MGRERETTDHWKSRLWKFPKGPLKFLKHKWNQKQNRPRFQYPHKAVRVGSLKIGEDSILGRVKIDLTGDVEIGCHCIISDDVKIFTHRHMFLEGEVANIVEEKGVVFTSLQIKENVVIGEGAMILSQVCRIGDSAVIGAGAVLTKDVGPGEIWAGNPARMVGRRGSPDLTPGGGD